MEIVVSHKMDYVSMIETLLLYPLKISWDTNEKYQTYKIESTLCINWKEYNKAGTA